MTSQTTLLPTVFLLKKQWCWKDLQIEEKNSYFSQIFQIQLFTERKKGKEKKIVENYFFLVHSVKVKNIVSKDYTSFKKNNPFHPRLCVVLPSKKMKNNIKYSI